jgi:hypothetical protein
MKDMMNAIHPVVAVAPYVATDNTAAVGSAIDRLGYDSATFVIATGTLADADATFAVLVEESDASGSGYEAVADGDLIGTEALAAFTFAADGATRKIGYRGIKRYLRITVTPSANTGNAPLCVIALLGHPSRVPAANPPA